MFRSKIIKFSPSTNNDEKDVTFKIEVENENNDPFSYILNTH
jgi:hypothetical protein